MLTLTNNLKLILSYAISILFAISLYILSVSIIVSTSFLNFDIQNHVLTKLEMESELFDVLLKYKDNILLNTNLLDYSQNNLKGELIRPLLNESYIQSFVEDNYTHILNDLSYFFSGKKDTLPNVIISPQYPAIKAPKSKHTISLNSILSFLNADEFIHSLNIIKLINFLVSSLKNMSILATLIFLTILLLLNIHNKYFKLSFIVYISLMISSFTIGYIFLNKYMFIFVNITTKYLPFLESILTKYIYYHLNMLILIYVCTMIIIILFFILNKKITALFNFIVFNIFKFDKNSNKTTPLKITLFFLVLLTIYSCISIIQTFSENSFYAIVKKQFQSQPTIEVIKAKDQSVYSLKVKLLHKNTILPIKDVPISISNTSMNDKYFSNFLSHTDDSGELKIELSKGYYFITFPTKGFPKNYIKPAPVYYSIDNPGTTILTFNLNEKTIPDSNYSFLEIELLDTLKKPVENIQLSLKSLESTGDNHIISITNTHGIASFKTPPGKYAVFFIKEEFPEEYIIPPSFNVLIESDIESKYSIILVDTDT